MIAGWERSPNWAKLAPRTQAQYQTYLRHLLVVEKAAVKDIRRAQLLDIRDAVMTAKGAGAAIAFARTTSAAFGWAVDRGWIEHSPAHKLQKDIQHGNLPAWTEGDVDLALTHLPEHLRRAVVLALYTGQRRGDLIAMPWTAYDGAHIRLMPEKTRRLAERPPAGHPCAAGAAAGTGRLAPGHRRLQSDPDHAVRRAVAAWLEPVEAAAGPLGPHSRFPQRAEHPWAAQIGGYAAALS